MASDLNKVMLIGRLTKDPELRYTQSGTPVASFSVANNRSYVVNGERKEEVSFFNCVAWSKLGELIVQYCKKGHRIGLEGRLQQRSWEDQNGNKRQPVEIVTDNVQFLTARNEQQSGTAAYNDTPPPPEFPQSSPEVDNNPFSDDDIPF